MQTTHQTRARGIVVALYHGKVVGRWHNEAAETGAGGHRVEAQEPTHERGS